MRSEKDKVNQTLDKLRDVEEEIAIDWWQQSVKGSLMTLPGSFSRFRKCQRLKAGQWTWVESSRFARKQAIFSSFRVLNFIANRMFQSEEQCEERIQQKYSMQWWPSRRLLNEIFCTQILSFILLFSSMVWEINKFRVWVDDSWIAWCNDVFLPVFLRPKVHETLKLNLFKLFAAS